jgi:hypothetical protein
MKTVGQGWVGMAMSRVLQERRHCSRSTCLIVSTSAWYQQGGTTVNSVPAWASHIPSCLPSSLYLPAPLQVCLPQPSMHVLAHISVPACISAPLQVLFWIGAPTSLALSLIRVGDWVATRKDLEHINGGWMIMVRRWQGTKDGINKR